MIDYAPVVLGIVALLAATTAYIKSKTKIKKLENKLKSLEENNGK